MNFYIEPPRGKHKHIRKRAKKVRLIVKNQTIVKYLMTHPEFTQDPKGTHDGFLVWRGSKSVRVFPAVITSFSMDDGDYIRSLWSDNPLYYLPSEPYIYKAELQLRQEGIEFFRNLFANKE